MVNVVLTAGEGSNVEVIRYYSHWHASLPAVFPSRQSLSFAMCKDFVAISTRPANIRPRLRMFRSFCPVGYST